MRIAFLVLQFPSLSETFILNQIIELINLGHDVEIYAEKKGDFSKIHKSVEEYGLNQKIHYSYPIPSSPILRLKKAILLIFKYYLLHPIVLFKALNIFQYGKKALSMRILFHAVPFLKCKNYDVIHCHFGPTGNTGTYLREIGVLTGKIVATFHGVDINLYPQKHGKDMYSKLFKRGDLITVNTNFTGSKVKELGCPEHKIHVLPVGLETSLYPFRKRFIKPGEKLKVLTIARLVEKKGIEYSLRAIERISKKYKHIEYYIIGDGHLKQHLQEITVELEIQHIVHFLGWMTQDEILNFCETTHIFMLSSVTASNGDKEGQGLVLQEAQAMGMPVLSTVHNGIPDGVMDGKSGFLVPEKNVDALAEKLQYLIENPEIWSEMGRIGRKFVEENYDIKTLNIRLLDIYKMLLGKDIKQLRISEKAD